MDKIDAIAKLLEISKLYRLDEPELSSILLHISQILAHKEQQRIIPTRETPDQSSILIADQIRATQTNHNTHES